MRTTRKRSASPSTAPPVSAKQMRSSGIDHTLSRSPSPTITLSIGKYILTNLTIQVWLEAEKLAAPGSARDRATPEAPRLHSHIFLGDHRGIEHAF